MRSDKTLSELRRAFLSDMGGDLLPHVALYEAAVQSESVLRILKEVFRELCPKVELKHGCSLAIVCFGSLARYEYMPGASDLDFLVVYRAIPGHEPDPNQVRSAILEPLATQNPWLILDDKDKILAGRCDDISSKEFKYQVLSLSDLLDGQDPLLAERRWQILLESRCLYGFDFYEHFHERITPRQSKPLLSEEGTVGRLNRLSLLTKIPEYMVRFDDPKRIHKSPSKYWKSRLLREVFQFANIANLVVDLADTDTSSASERNDLRDPTALKLIRLTRSARWIDQRLTGQTSSIRRFAPKIEQILQGYQIEPSRLPPVHANYRSEAAKLCHGVMIAIIGRFNQARILLYDPNVQAVLDNLSPSTIFDSRFWESLADGGDGRVINSLRDARLGYLKYIAAATSLIRDSIERWTMRTVPRDWDQALKAFEQVPPW